MIRKGQIYKIKDEYGFNYVITKPAPVLLDNGSVEKRYQVICDDGFCIKLKEEEVLQDELIAEYPTWQEAVNSKEFKE